MLINPYYYYVNLLYSSNRMVPDKKRPPRVAFGPGGLLPRFNLNQSLGQQYLYIVNDR